MDGGEREWTEKDIASAAAFSMGFGIWAIRKPGRNQDWKWFDKDKAPEGLKVTDENSAYKTIRLWHGGKPVESSRDLGIVFADVRASSRQMGKAGAIRFRQDPSDTGRRKRMPKTTISRDIYSHKGTLSHRTKGKRISTRGLMYGR